MARNKYGLKLDYLPYKDDARRKLTEKQILEIKNKFSRGESIFSLAEKFAVHSTTIRRHVDEQYMKKCREYDLKYKQMIGLPENYKEISKRTRERHKKRFSNYNKKIRKIPEVKKRADEIRPKHDKNYRKVHQQEIRKRDKEFYEDSKKCFLNKFSEQNKCVDCEKRTEQRIYGGSK